MLIGGKKMEAAISYLAATNKRKVCVKCISAIVL